MKKEICPGCRQNRYNMGRGYQETKNDSVINCDHCWHMTAIKYNRKTKEYECPVRGN